MGKFYASHDRVFFIVWHDFKPSERGGAVNRGNSGSSAKGTSIQGEYSTTEGEGSHEKILAWTCETADGRSGKVMIGDVAYDLVDGGVFLVSDTEGDPTVAQLSREIMATAPIQETLRALAANDPQIGDFVGQAATAH